LVEEFRRHGVVVIENGIFSVFTLSKTVGVRQFGLI